MAIEIPMRALVQNIFVLFGATLVLFYSLTLPILLTAVFWVKFIVIQQIMTKKGMSSKVVLDAMASIWFSVWVGVIYLTTGSIIATMVTHALERWFAYMLRKKNVCKQNKENETL